MGRVEGEEDVGMVSQDYGLKLTWINRAERVSCCG
jgi:hypothetical protein